ncbi:hypothetical protein CYY_009718 [Polysphondylium violaceum]|uniref:Fe2OG dioxygenase domain-containing protein n=1 Tax=Polysphondylium violaceum TaxID=133409 RepID=A0A8J4PL06_9MYCE|nr:hypothetical protein CYY_009718 [Polysphondylium violaceum]
MTEETLPIIDLKDFIKKDSSQADRNLVANDISVACKEHGFFYIKGHGIEQELIDRLDSLSRVFFKLPQEVKMELKMESGGRAWRGFFPLGGELTSNMPDWKEGLYLGTELQDDHPDVQKELPMHGKNLFFSSEQREKELGIEGFRSTILQYIEAVTNLGHVVMEAIAISLGLAPDYFSSKYTKDPLILFRIFNYPSQPIPEGLDVQWGVGEHTDYGMLTILSQDDIGGLQVCSQKNGQRVWIQAPPIKGTFVCNIGDMLDRMTGGLYRSTPHRVKLNTSGRDRISFPLFFDPNFCSFVKPIDNLPKVENQDDSNTRWDHANVHMFTGTYGEYLLNKVGKVFPQLKTINQF